MNDTAQMGKDNQPKDRQKAKGLRRRAAVRQVYDRLLVVCEGEKTEPHYVKEIRDQERLASAHVHVMHGQFGTEPAQVVAYAEHLFTTGDRAKGIEARAFDKVFVVFDRDDHQTYYDALSKIAALNEKVKNDEHKLVPFIAVASVPCFEVWLLMHFDDVLAPMHRNEVYARLKEHLPGYDKGQPGHWAKTKGRLEAAQGRADAQAALTSAFDGEQPFTSMCELVRTLLSLKATYSISSSNEQ